LWRRLCVMLLVKDVKRFSSLGKTEIDSLLQIVHRGIQLNSFSPRNVVKCLCSSTYSKTLSRPVIYALFLQFLSASGGFAIRPNRGSIPGLLWGNFVSRPPNLPTPGKKSCGLPCIFLPNLNSTCFLCLIYCIMVFVFLYHFRTFLLYSRLSF